MCVRLTKSAGKADNKCERDGSGEGQDEGGCEDEDDNEEEEG